MAAPEQTRRKSSHFDTQMAGDVKPWPADQRLPATTISDVVDMSVAVAKAIEDTFQRVRRWIRTGFSELFSRLFLVVTLILAVVGIGVALPLDASLLSFLTTHPVTANILAGFLGLPAAFLVVNLAAERAVRWADSLRWSGIRRDDMEEVRLAWYKLRRDILLRYGFVAYEDLEKLEPSPLEMKLNKPSMAALDLMTMINAKTFEDSDPDTLVKFRELVDQITYYRGSVEEFSSTEQFSREHLRSLLLPRMEARAEDPDTVELIRDAEKDLMRLESSWRGYQSPEVQGGFSTLEHRVLHDRFPLNVRDTDVYTWKHCMAVLSRLFSNAAMLVESMDRLVRHIEQMLQRSRLPSLKRRSGG